ncbi:MAG: hypothetical protein EOP39_15470 [Rubrivivax sp.]|nr:MAG: hypothetical protein EOP39_15470 [Rubrivivax sp.]
MQALPIRYQNQPDHPAQRVILGLSVITIGGMALADKLHWVEQPLLSTFWPVALVLVGLARLVWPSRKAGAVLGAGLMLAGAVMTAHNLGLATVPLRDAWPVFVILAGLGLLQRAKLPSVAATRVAGDRIDLDANFSNLHLRSDSPSFQGGRLDVGFGSLVLDLRQATLSGGEAVLDISARLSNIDLRVPRGWQVVVDMSHTASSISDCTAPHAHCAPRLVLRGTARFSGVEITH